MPSRSIPARSCRHRRCFTLGLCVALTLTVNVAWAVQREIPITSGGQPLANATITITLPDGTTQEEETNRRGILIFDFDQAGDYKLSWQGGEMTYTVTAAMLASGAGAGGASGGLGAGLATGIGFAAAAGLSAISDDDDDEPASPGGGGANPAAGTYTCATTTTTQNADNHPLGTLAGTYIVTINGTTAVVAHTNGNTNFTLNGTISGARIDATGSGTFVGFTGTQFVYGGDYVGPNTLTNATLFGTCAACPDSNGNGQADQYRVTLNGCAK